MVKLAQTTIRSTELSIAYSPCYSIVLMCYNGSGIGDARNLETLNYKQAVKRVLPIPC